mgnify:CR=1 FL=1
MLDPRCWRTRYNAGTRVMDDLIGQLERVAATARRMLVAQRVCQFVTAAAVTLAGAGAVDYVLRLPGGLRLAIGAGAAAVGVWWLVTRMGRAWSFRPDAATVALRAEGLYPQLRDQLATAVEFAAHPRAYADPQLTAALASASVARAEGAAAHVALRRVLDPTGTYRWLAVLASAVVVVSAIVAWSPGGAALALERWLLPLGDAQWPRRTQIESLVRASVWPTDTPVKLEAAVTRGYRPGMRAWVYTRVVRGGRAGDWRATLLNDQEEHSRGARHGRFERILELNELVGEPRVGATSSAAAAREAFVVELYMSAGDDRTPTQQFTMLARPAARQVTATIDPPAYAQGLVPSQRVALDEQTGSVATASGLQGSTVTLDLTFNRELPIAAASAVLPGLAGEDDASVASPAASLQRRFTLSQTVQTPITLVDEHGLRSVSERVYRVEAVEDKPPSAALVEPVADESVLPTAVIAIEAAAQDDVGVESLELEVEAPVRDAQTTDATVAARIVEREEGRSPRLRLVHTLPLTPLALHTGDAVTLTAIARDGFALGDARHDAVRSAPRILRIIDVATLVGQVRSELANVRQQAIRLETAQQQALDTPPEAAHDLEAPQQQISRRLESQQQAVRTLAQRLDRNQLDEPALTQTLERAGALLDQAHDASDAATRAMQENQPQQGQLQQTRARDKLGELIALLDQGRDALTLQLQLRQMLTQQEQLADDTRRLLPQTAGQRPEDLPPDVAGELADAAQRQASLAQQADDLARQMQTTADALQRQSESDQDQAAAQALREAAQIAQRQGLAPQMSQASQSAQENRLSEAGQQQLGAVDTMQQMMGAMGSQQQKQMEMLRRRLAELTELIRRLVEQQKAQLARLEAVGEGGELAGLDEGMLALRRSTMGVEAEARKSPQTGKAGEALGKAVVAQAGAVTALRSALRDAAESAERQSLAHLEEALQQVDDARQQAEQDMTRQQRDELEQAYRKLAQQQAELRERTAKLTDLPRLDRRQRADLVQLGHEEADLQIAAADLREKVEQTLVFLQAHRRIDESAARVARQLRAGLSDAGVLFEQAMIHARLSAMADALKQAQQDEDEFRENQQGGGGGGGGGQPPPLVPPVAELKLIRGTQEAIYRQTRAADAQRQADPQASGLDQRLMDLSAQQRELGDLGRRLMEQVKQ